MIAFGKDDSLREWDGWDEEGTDDEVGKFEDRKLLSEEVRRKRRTD